MREKAQSDPYLQVDLTPKTANMNLINFWLTKNYFGFCFDIEYISVFSYSLETTLQLDFFWYIIKYLAEELDLTFNFLSGSLYWLVMWNCIKLPRAQNTW